MSRQSLPSPALVVAVVALVFALGGGAYAAFKLPKNSVTTREVKDRSLLAKDFEKGQLPAGKTGAQGPIGPQGPAGTPGAKGETGPKGDNGSEGAPATTKRTVLSKNDGVVTAVPGSAWALHETIGSFTKAASDTVVRLTWTGSVHYDQLFCVFQIRVDGAAENGSTSTDLSTATGGIVNFPNVGGQNGGQFSSYSVWTGLPAGNHDVTVWTRGPGAGTPNCQTNPGNYPAGTRVYVEEGR